MARGVHGDPFAASKLDHLMVGDRDGRVGHLEPTIAVAHLHEDAKVVVAGRRPMATPRFGTTHHLSDAFQIGVGVGLQQFGIVLFDELAFFEMLAETVVGQDVGAGLVAQLRSAAEVVEVGVGDHGGVDIAQFESGALEAVEERVP